MRMSPETYALLKRHVEKFIPLEREAKQFDERRALWDALWNATKEGLAIKAVYEDWLLTDDHVHTALCRLAREVRAAK